MARIAPKRAQAPSKKPASTRKLLKKRSNRPNYDRSASSAGYENDGEERKENEEEGDLLAELERRQRAFFDHALPEASTSREVIPANTNVVKSIWEMDEDDFEAREQESEGESEDEAEAVDLGSSKVEVVAFSEPRLSAAQDAGAFDRTFMSTKVKNVMHTPSVADLANSKQRKGKSKAVATPDEEVEEEKHLSTLDSHLSNLIKPLASTSSGTSQLPSLLSSLPLAPTKTPKGLTPLPANTPRAHRRGQEAANLARARKRDADAGILAGQKRGREAKTLKEKRKEEGKDKRQRGMKAAVGKLTRGGELRLSEREVKRGNGELGKKGKGKRW